MLSFLLCTYLLRIALINSFYVLKYDIWVVQCGMGALDGSPRPQRRGASVCSPSTLSHASIFTLQSLDMAV